MSLAAERAATERPAAKRILIAADGRTQDATDDAIRACLAAKTAHGFWLDIENPGEPEYQLFREVFHFHPLALEDVWLQNQRPKLEEYTNYSFMVLFVADRADGDLRFKEHHLFLGDRYVVSIHNGTASELADLRQRLGVDPELTQKRPGFLAYLVVDQIVDAGFPIIEQLDEDVDDVSDRCVARAAPEDLAAISRLKHQVADFRRVLGAERDIAQRHVVRGVEEQDQELTLYYRDVYDHLVRQYEMIDALRDLLGNALDIYLSTVSNRLNMTVKQLTVITSLFLPLAFLTGFFGMNFELLVNAIKSPAALAVGIILMVLSIAVQLYIFKRKGWLG